MIKMQARAAAGKKRVPRSEPEVNKQERIIRDPAFANRLNKACDSHPHCPPMHKGRLVWLQARLLSKFEQSVSLETVRKWFAGEARPRPARMQMVAALLEVDEAWLSIGTQAELDPRERKIRNATVDGAVNVVAGFVQMCGGYPAFPDEDARDSPTDIYAIIRGKQYALHVAVGSRGQGDDFRFVLPVDLSGLTLIGVIPVAPLRVDFVLIPQEIVAEQGNNRGGSIELVVPKARLQRIDTFGERL